MYGGLTKLMIVGPPCCFGADDGVGKGFVMYEYEF
jgi:hypothetical protein